MAQHHRHGLIVATALGCLLLQGWPAPPGVLRGAAAAAVADETAQSAIFLLEQSTRASRRGEHHLMLLSLRHLRDPALVPIFSQLVEREHPALKMHGMLGLAETDPQRRLDLVRLAKIENPALQAEVIGAAMEAQLLSDEQAVQLVSWPGLDLGVKLVVAIQLVAHDAFQHPELLQEALASDNEARAAMAGLMLHQLGDPAGLAALETLNKSADPKRDEIRMNLLRTALRGKYERAGRWALGVATEPGVSPRLGMLALQAAMRFAVPEAMVVWKQQLESTSDMAQRVRLALVALQSAEHLEPGLFDPLVTADDALLAQIGRAGRAVASGQGVVEPVIALVQMHHPIANEWALQYAKGHADKGVGQQILMALVLAYDAGARNSPQLLDDAVSATQALYDLDPASAGLLLRPVLVAPQTHRLLVQGILLGLIRTSSTDAATVIDSLPAMGSPGGDAMATLLRAKSDAPLDDAALRELGLVVRGGAGLTPALRVQAAWLYLKRTNQTQLAVAHVLGD